MLSGKCFTCLMHCLKLSLVRLTSFSKPSEIVKGVRNKFGIKYELGSNKSTILLAGSDSNS